MAVTDLRTQMKETAAFISSPRLSILHKIFFSSFIIVVHSHPSRIHFLPQYFKIQLYHFFIASYHVENTRNTFQAEPSSFTLCLWPPKYDHPLI